MPAPLLSRRDLEFMLYEVFNVESQLTRERYSDHNRETIDAAIDVAQAIAEKYFLPIRQKVDTHQPEFDGEKVQMIPEIKEALDAVVAAGKPNLGPGSPNQFLCDGDPREEMTARAAPCDQHAQRPTPSLPEPVTGPPARCRAEPRSSPPSSRASCRRS